MGKTKEWECEKEFIGRVVVPVRVEAVRNAEELASLTEWVASSAMLEAFLTRN